MKIQNLIAAMLGLVFAYTASAQERTLGIGVREQYRLEIPDNLERIAVGDPDILDLIVLPGNTKKKGSVLLVGKKPGRTGVTAWPRDRDPVTWEVSVLTEMQRKLVSGGASIEINNDNAIIHGQAPSLISHANTTAAATRAVSKEKVLDTSTVATSGMVQIDVKIVEFSKRVLKEAGFDFLFNQNRGSTFSFGLNNFTSNLLTSPNTPTAQAFNLLGSTSINAKLRLIEENGLSRVLAQPSLAALSGQSASFLAGGELPIPQSGGLGTTTIVFKQFGIGLTVTPTVLSADRIALKVAPEASDIDYQNALVVSGIAIPAISTRRAETTLELGNGESFVIGGLVSRNTKSSVNKVPFLGDLPILGSFFRSMKYSQDEKELVIIVTPHLVKPLAKDTKLVLPGEEREKVDSPANAWGSYVLGIGSNDDLPGFSK